MRWAEVILVEFPWQFDYCRRCAPGVPLVLAAHNLEWSKFSSYAEAQGVRARRSPWLRHIRRSEAKAVACADLVLAVSPDDRLDFIRVYRKDPDRVVEIPNGADIRTYHPVDRATRESRKRELGLPPKPVACYVGANIPPNVAGLAWVRRLASMSDRFTFVAIGPLFRRPERQGNLIATGLVDDYPGWLQAADFSLCPIEHGGGTKIKLLEALAAGLPVVAFEESLRGTALEPGRHVLVSPKSEVELLSALNRLADDPALAETLGANGRAFVAEHHDWERIAEKLSAALTQVVESGRLSRRPRNPLTRRGP
jgi:glycosyltransferase involved in cell wall biosynthesis